ncbi:glycerophosphodiester phosphodiesterase family protein [soil metagenome]
MKFTKRLTHPSIFGLLLLLGVFLPVTHVQAQSATMYKLNIKSPKDLQQFFAYSPDRIPFVSAHRGGARRGFPENCIATFENTLKHVHATMEIDPRLTKDGVIVLMHDATLERTTNGTGRVEDFTYEELKKLKLKDPEGTVTAYGIPTLDEALQWAKGKTVLFIDNKKAVPWEMTEQKIRQHGAEAYAMVIAYSFEEAQNYHARNKDIMMEVFIPNRERLAAFDQSGVPWKNVVAFIAHAKSEDKELYGLIHQRGAMCMIGSGRIYDKEFTAGNKGVYEEMIREGADVIEADLAIEAGQALAKLAPAKSSKRKFFGKTMVN